MLSWVLRLGGQIVHLTVHAQPLGVTTLRRGEKVLIVIFSARALNVTTPGSGGHSSESPDRYRHCGGPSELPRLGAVAFSESTDRYVYCAPLGRADLHTCGPSA